jgi:hypothetical protein
MCQAVANPEERWPVKFSMVEAGRSFDVPRAPMAAGRSVVPCDTPVPGRRSRAVDAAHTGSDWESTHRPGAAGTVFRLECGGSSRPCVYVFIGGNTSFQRCQMSMQLRSHLRVDKHQAMTRARSLECARSIVLLRIPGDCLHQPART